jgi:L-2-hydroxyglutarate oxidase LhgO
LAGLTPQIGDDGLVTVIDTRMKSDTTIYLIACAGKFSDGLLDGYSRPGRKNVLPSATGFWRNCS